MSEQQISEVDKLLSTDFDQPKNEPTENQPVPKAEESMVVEEVKTNPEAQVPKTETEENQPTATMEVENQQPVVEVKTPPKRGRGRTPKKQANPEEQKPADPNAAEEVKKTPGKRGRKKSTTPKKATPTKTSPKKPAVEKEIVTDPLKVSTRGKSAKPIVDWSDLIYGSAEQYIEGDTLAVRAPKDSGDEFWLCALDGIGTEENKDDLEITWYESKGTGVYVEGEEDDISPDSVICRTRLNAGKDGAWVLPQVELKAIRDALKLEREESSEIIPEEDNDKSDEASYKEGEDGEEAPKKRGPKPKVPTEEKPKREPKSGDKRKAALDANGEPKPKRQYKKREKKVPEGANAAPTPTNGNTATTESAAKPETEAASTATTTTTTTTTTSSIATPNATTPVSSVLPTTSNVASTTPSLPTTPVTSNIPYLQSMGMHLPFQGLHQMPIPSLQLSNMNLNMANAMYMQMAGHSVPMHLQPPLPGLHQMTGHTLPLHMQPPQMHMQPMPGAMPLQQAVTETSRVQPQVTHESKTESV